MNSVRTTVSFDETLHRQLLMQALNMGVSLSELINIKLANKNVGSDKSTLEAKINSDVGVFKRLAKKFGKTDWATVVRKERDRDRG